jgi:nucleoside-diphosphate-sugar epimerase
MKVLVTGNMGYVGSVLNRVLVSEYPDIKIFGYDTGFFAHSLTGADFMPERDVSIQFFGDVRDISPTVLEGVDAVVHLAAISNDPMGNEFEEVTTAINRSASVNLARASAKAGVKNFVFASSCSMYGQADGGARKETDPTNPLTAYAQSKIGVEKDLYEADLGSMVFTSLRFATACGWSSRLRLDLVLNDFVASAVVSKKISILSDGTPWRPLIDVEDMSRAISWGIARKAENGGAFLAVNAGSTESNYQMKDLAEAVAKLIPETSISINKDAPPDRRSYSVDFSLYRDLAPNHQPKVTLNQSIERLRDGLLAMNFAVQDFRQSSFMRLNSLRLHLDSRRLAGDLRWLKF